MNRQSTYWQIQRFVKTNYPLEVVEDFIETKKKGLRALARFTKANPDETFRLAKVKIEVNFISIISVK